MEFVPFLPNEKIVTLLIILLHSYRFHNDKFMTVHNFPQVQSVSLNNSTSSLVAYDVSPDRLEANASPGLNSHDGTASTATDTDDFATTRSSSDDIVSVKVTAE